MSIWEKYEEAYHAAYSKQLTKAAFRCKCGSFAINEHAHGRIKGKHSDLCDVCYWREEAKQARREGWEQGKKEAFALALNYKGKGCVRSIDAESVSLLIAAMEYKEKAND